MLDVNLLREDLEGVRRKLGPRGAAFDFDGFARLDAEWKKARHTIDERRARQNELSREIGAVVKAGGDVAAKKEEVRRFGDETRALEDRLRAIEEERDGLLLTVPNVPDDSVPDGADETGNVIVATWGEKPAFGFAPKAHWDIGADLGILDLPRAAKLAGARFPLLRGAGAALERGLAAFMLDLQTREHGYTEFRPPLMANAETLTGTGQLPKFAADLFRVEGTDYYLIPTSEVPLVALHRDEILDGARLPLRHTALTPCFRSEAGAAGKDTRGIIRVHQFDKVELVQITRPEDSGAALEEMVRNAGEVLRRLGLHHRVVLLCKGDMGFASRKTYDIEVWLPGQQTYREISSISNCGDFQARRAKIRFRREARGKAEFAHTLNGSGLAVGRTWVAILENCQRADGSVAIPEALRPWCGGLDVIRPEPL